MLEKLRPLLEDPAVLKIGHNFKYDWVMFDKSGINVEPIDDTMVMSFDLDAGKSFGHSLNDLAKAHFDHECISYKSLCGTGARQVTFDKVPLGPATEYAGEDADITLRSWLRLRPRIAQENVARVYERVDKPLVPVISRMERRGIKVDRDYLARLSAEFGRDIQSLEEKIYEAACGPFTIGSPQQLGEVLYGRLGLKGGRKGKSGQYSTDVNELERLASEGVECATLVLDWRQLAKLKSTYTDSLQQQINPETGRVHTSFSLTGAQTGRLSSNDPNLQNIPIRTEVGRKIRDAFIADSGHKLLSADYSQIELRLAAHMADVPQLKAAFNAARTSIRSPPRSCSEPSIATRAERRRRSISPSSTVFRRGGWLDGSEFRGTRARPSSTVISSASPEFGITSTRRWVSSANTASRARCSGARLTSSRTFDRPTLQSVAAPSAPQSTRRSREPAPTL